MLNNNNEEGCAIAQVISYWLPTTVTLVQPQITSCGICSG
jgi:hypothetical protein